MSNESSVKISVKAIFSPQQIYILFHSVSKHGSGGTLHSKSVTLIIIVNINTSTKTKV